MTRVELCAKHARTRQRNATPSAPPPLVPCTSVGVRGAMVVLRRLGCPVRPVAPCHVTQRRNHRASPRGALGFAGFGWLLGGMPRQPAGVLSVCPVSGALQVREPARPHARGQRCGARRLSPFRHCPDEARTNTAQQHSGMPDPACGSRVARQRWLARWRCSTGAAHVQGDEWAVRPGAQRRAMHAWVPFAVCAGGYSRPHPIHPGARLGGRTCRWEIVVPNLHTVCVFRHQVYRVTTAHVLKGPLCTPSLPHKVHVHPFACSTLQCTIQTVDRAPFLLREHLRYPCALRAAAAVGTLVCTWSSVNCGQRNGLAHSRTPLHPVSKWQSDDRSVHFQNQLRATSARRVTLLLRRSGLTVCIQ